MRVIPWLCCILSHVWTVKANVEKTIFLGPDPVTLANARPSLGDLRLDSLSLAHRSILETKLPVQFPTSSAPRGRESWLLLQGLDRGRRYEARICWPATSPTDFWLDTYPITTVFDTPNLIASLAKYSEQRQAQYPELPDFSTRETELPSSAQSILFLRIQAAASYYSINRTLMEHPPPVDADIILDPYVLNVLPQSLVPTVAYISIVSVGAWFLSGYIYRRLLSVAAESPPKPHTD